MKSYNLYTQYDYERNFRVEVDDEKVRVYLHAWEALDKSMAFRAYQPIINLKSHICIYVGIDENDPDDSLRFSNTLIIRATENKYIFVGEVIYAFELDDTITYYTSPMIKGQSFPYLLTDTHCYLLLDNVRIPKIYEGNPYEWYYNGNEDKGEEFDCRLLHDNYLAPLCAGNSESRVSK